MTATTDQRLVTGERPAVRVRELDWIMLAVATLCCLGLVMAVSVQSLDRGQDALGAMQSQGTKLAFGLVALIGLALVPMPLLRRRAVLWFGLGAALVYGAAVFGPEWNHARRWISIAGRSFQPVDFARLAMILAIAAAIARAQAHKGSLLRGVVPVLAPAGLLAAGLFLQPDKGNALLCLALGASMAVAAGIGLRWLVLAAGAMLPVVVTVVLADGYSRGRIDKWLSGDPPEQVQQSIQAFELGGLTGEGIGAGWRKMGFVPEAQNDFVFAMVGEELGFVGSLLVVLSFTLIGIAGCSLVLRMRDPFHRYVVFGCTVGVCAQALINVLVTTGAAPAKGIDLPFVSSGGTNLAAMLGSVGLIGNAARADLLGQDSSDADGAASG